MEKIIVNLGKKKYPITIGCDVFKNSSIVCPLKYGDQVVFITNNRVAPLYLDMLIEAFNQLGILTDQLIIPDGEQSKSLIILDVIFTKLLNQNYDRNIVLVALGGGVIGDLTGFAAATYQRGIRFMQVPTTLLAQVDASIGGKTGINHILGKNMIGAFYQPVAVIIDLNFLYTLTVQDFSSGLSEIIKYAVAFDSIFFDWLEHNLDNILNLDLQSLKYCVRRCCELKISVITVDEYDVGIRNFLNLGHTYGHAIESYLKYKTCSHGEAVAIGMMMAVRTAQRLGKFDNCNDAERISLLLERAHLPVHSPVKMSPQDYLEYMMRDKKSRSGRQINLVLPISIGNMKNFFNVDHDLILDVIKDSCN